MANYLDTGDTGRAVSAESHGALRIPANDSALVTINNGHSGTNRIDLIVFRYTKDSTGKETVDLAVIQGEDSTGTAAAPATIDGDILTGAMQADFPLYRVELKGLNIVSVTAMFDVIGNISQITKKNKELAAKLPVYGTTPIIETGANSYKDTSVKFGKTFSKAPVVVISLSGGSQNTKSFGVQVLSTTTSGCVIRTVNGNSSSVSIMVNWCAFPKEA